MDTKTLTFRGLSLTLVLHPVHGWGLPARMLGWALGYSNEGQKLTDQLQKPNWNIGADAVMLTGDDLGKFKQGAGLQGSLLKSNSMVFLTMAGVRKVLLKSNAKAAKEFRTFLAENGGEAVKGLDLAMRTSVGGSQGHMSPLAGGSDLSLAELRKMLTWMRKEGLATTEELKVYGLRAVELCLRQMEPQTLLKTAEPVPVPQASLGLSLPGVPSGKTLIGDHPLYPGFLTADELGKAFGRSGNEIKHLIRRYCVEQMKSDLPNNQARALTKQGKMPVDAQGFFVLYDPVVDGYARWKRGADNQVVWRNYWGPKASREIGILIAEYLKKNGMVNPTQSSFPSMAPKATS